MNKVLVCETLRMLLCQAKSTSDNSSVLANQPVPLAVLDTGLHLDSPKNRRSHLRGTVSIRALAAAAFVDWTSEPAKGAFGHARLSPTDPVGHGTKVALIAASSHSAPGTPAVPTRQWAHRLLSSMPGCVAPDSATGAASAAPGSTVYAHRVFDAQAEGHTWWFNGALTAPCLFASTACVINISLGGPDRGDRAMKRLATEAMARGHLLVAAMGNDGPSWDTVNDPAELRGVLAVGSATVSAVKLAVLLLPTLHRGHHVLPWLREQLLAQPTIAQGTDGYSQEAGGPPTLQHALCKHFQGHTAAGGSSHGGQQAHYHTCTHVKSLNSELSQQLHALQLASPFSSRGFAAGGAPEGGWQNAPKPDLLQLGDKVVFATSGGQRTQFMRGTSAAAPAVAGAAASTWGAACVVAQLSLAAAAQQDAMALLCSWWTASPTAVFRILAGASMALRHPAPHAACQQPSSSQRQGCAAFATACLPCQAPGQTCGAKYATELIKLLTKVQPQAATQANSATPDDRLAACSGPKLVQPQAVKAILLDAAVQLRLNMSIGGRESASLGAADLTPPYFAQGAGLLAAAPRVTRKALTAHILVQPPSLDFTDCPYMWPLCDAAIHPAAPPIHFFFSATSTAGHAEMAREIAVLPAENHGEEPSLTELRVRCSHAQPWASTCSVDAPVLMPNVSAVALQLSAISGTPQCSSDGRSSHCIPATGKRQTFTVSVCMSVAPVSMAELLLQASMGVRVVACGSQLCMRLCSIVPVTVLLQPQPPRAKRVAWLLGGARTAPLAGYVLSNTLAGSAAYDSSLPAASRVMQWQHGGPWGTHASLYHALRRSGFVVELHTSAWKLPKNVTDLPAVALLVDPDVAPSSEERAALHQAADQGMSVVVLAEHFDQHMLSGPPREGQAELPPNQRGRKNAEDPSRRPSPYEFFDHSSQKWWQASLAGSDAPGLNRLLSKWGVAFDAFGAPHAEVGVQMPIWQEQLGKGIDNRFLLEFQLPFFAGIALSTAAVQPSQLVASWSAKMQKVLAGTIQPMDSQRVVIGAAVRPTNFNLRSRRGGGRLVVWGDTSCVDDNLLLDRGWPPRPRQPVYLKRGKRGTWSPQDSLQEMRVHAAAEALRGLGITAAELRSVFPHRAQQWAGKRHDKTPLHSVRGMRSFVSGSQRVYAALDDGGSSTGLGNGNCAAVVSRMVLWAAADCHGADDCDELDELVTSIHIN